MCHEEMVHIYYEAFSTSRGLIPFLLDIILHVTCIQIGFMERNFDERMIMR